MLTKGDRRNPISLAFPNGSRIVGLPGTEATVRGFSSVSLVLIEEAARVRATAAECGRIPAEHLEEEMRTLADRTYRREYCCEFAPAEDAVFDPEMLQLAFRDDIKPYKNL
jgi:hypothetical protein